MDQNSVEPLENLLDFVRDNDGFPIGRDEDILALSYPPFYTACPNPYIKQFIEEYGKSYDPENDDYEKTPFIGDVSEGKNDEIYRVHTYHTKVPYKAIMNFVEHYTEPGDIVFDGFCGSGMTGIAAGLLKRRSVLSDLSPAATFIAHNYTTPINIKEYEKNAKWILKEIERECDWMFETYHTKNAINMKTGEHPSLIDNLPMKGKIKYTLWSDVFICPYCRNEYDFWNVAVEKETGRVKKNYLCLNCNAELTKVGSEPATMSRYDSSTQKEMTTIKQIPVLIIYSIKGTRYKKKADEYDLGLLDKIERSEIPYWYPTEPMMFRGVQWGDTWRRGIHLGVTHVHHFYTKRNLWVLAALAHKSAYTRNFMNVTSVATIITKMYRFRSQGGILGAGGGPLTGTLYVPSLKKEISMLKALREHVMKSIKLKKFISNITMPIIQTGSQTQIKQVDNASIDYIFTDPPFGDNLMYSELNFIWESWLKVFTNNKEEAIISNTQNKGLDEYIELMTQCFREMYRILKPNRWMTVVFHNSRASVWNGIQEAMTRAGFVIAQVAVLDRKQGSFKQVTSAGAVKNDLVINAYKPRKEFAQRFLKNAGEGLEVDFVKQQLEHLPVRPNIERTEKMLYSRMLAHYVENGFKIKYDATNFYKLLSDNFIPLDGYWFLHNQVGEYNEWKKGLSLDQLKEVLDSHQVLFVTDEKSALTWLHNFLHSPKDYGDIYTAYQQITTITEDRVPELRELLDGNFIFENGKYRRPISQEEKQKINKNREKELERAFQKLLKQEMKKKGKTKNVRREALIYGFTKCYQEERYQDILTVANKLYASTLESSGDIMDFVDIARIKTSGEKEKKIEDHS